MQIKFNSTIKNTYYLIKKIYQQNDLSNYILNDFLMNSFDSINQNIIDEILKENKNYSLDNAYCSAFYSIMGIEDDDIELESLNENNNLSSFTMLNSKDFENNDFYKFIKEEIEDNLSSTKYHLKWNYYQPYEGLLYDDIKLNNLYEINKVGYFVDRFDYLNLLENNQVWMNITPFEINTMKKSIDKAKGKVLTFGLGLGYFAYMVSNKEEVESITIVEKDKNIIYFIFKNIISKFKNKNKIKIINDDIYNYSPEKLKEYNFIFVDTYRQADDGLKFYFDLYSTFKNTNCDFWIEDSIISQLRKYIFLFLASNFDKKYFKEYDFDNNQNQILTFLDNKLKNKVIDNEKDLYRLFDKDFIKSLF